MIALLYTAPRPVTLALTRDPYPDPKPSPKPKPRPNPSPSRSPSQAREQLRACLSLETDAPPAGSEVGSDAASEDDEVSFVGGASTYDPHTSEVVRLTLTLPLPLTLGLTLPVTLTPNASPSP